MDETTDHQEDIAKIALTIVLITAFTAAWLTFTTAIWTAMSAIAISLPAEYRVLFFFLPDNIPTLLGTAISADLSIYLYKYINRNIDLRSSA